MKKIIILIIASITFASTSFGQRQVFLGQNMLRNEAKNSFYIMFNDDEKKVVEDLENFMKVYGKFSESDKHYYKVTNINLPSISSTLETIEINFEESKYLLKVAFFFEDNKNIVLNSFSLDKDAAKKLIEDFSKFYDIRKSKDFLDYNLKMAEDNVSGKQKDVKKIEKNIASNLKYQKKYGKVLDSTPELLAEALAAKEELIDQLYSDSTAAQLDLKAEEELKKEATKKEKEIAKIQKTDKKNAARLDKKEREFEELKAELSSEIKYLKNLEKVVFDIKKLL